MKKWQRVTLFVIAILVVCAVVVALVAPVVIRSQATKRVEAATGRKLTIGRIFVNPFTWSAGMEGVHLSERNSSATFVSFSSARLSVSPRSLLKGVPIVSEFRVVSPSVSIERSAPDSYNFSDLLVKKPKAAQPGEVEEKEEDSRFCINNITISRGTITFHDRAVRSEKRHVVSNLDISVPFVSNIPYLADRYITPRFSALVNGSPLRLEGKLKKLPRSAEVILALNVQDVSLPYYMAYMPTALPITIPAGSLSTAAELTYRVTDHTRPQILIAGAARLNGLDVRERGGAPLAALAKGEVTVKEADLLGRRYDVSSINLDRLSVNLGRDRKGVWNFARLGSEEKEEKPSAAKKEGEKPPVVRLGSARLREGKLTLTDRQPQPGFSTTISGISLDLSDYASTEDRPAPFALSAVTERGEKLATKGTVIPQPLAAAASLELNGVQLAPYYPYLAQWLTRPVTGKLAVSGDLAYDAKAGLRVEKANVALDAVSASFAGGDGAKIGRLALENGSFDISKRRLAIQRIVLRQSDLRFSRDREGKLSPLTLLKERSEASPSAARPQATGKGERPFSWSIASVSGEGMDFRFRDGMKEDQPEFMVRKMKVSLKNLSDAEAAPVPFSVSASYGRNGGVALAGEYVPRPAAVRGTFNVRGLALTDFESYFPPNLNITLADGSLDAAGKVNISQRESGWTGNFTGDAGIRSFYCLDAQDEDLLKWESLQIEGVSGTIAPFTLAITDVVLNHYYSKIVVEENGTLNLQHLVTRKEEGEPQAVVPGAEVATTAVPAPQQKGAAPPASTRNIKVGAVVLQDGILNFTDNHLNPTYSSTFYNLGGRISGLTSDANRFADVDLRGNLENQSPLRITGQINPLRDDLFLDIKMRFTDIELSPLSPYSSTYLGYLIDKGKLFLDLKYHIEQKKLDSENTVFLDQLTLGQKVDSPQATSLPVRLAIALLKDRKGEIHLNLPVSGRTDDPKFSVWGVLMQMLKNLAIKAATAPFSLLQSMFGGKEEFSSISFGYGSAALKPAEQEKLAKLSGALRDRPALKIEVTGYADREHDPEGLRKELLEKKIRTEKFLELVKERKNQTGDSPDTVKVSAEEYPKYLKLVYRKEKFPKPRTVIGTVKDLPEAEMKKLIYANTVIGTKDLQALAAERTATVRDFLVEKGNLDAARIFQKSGDLFKAPAKPGETGSRVEFGMAAQ